MQFSSPFFLTLFLSGITLLLAGGLMLRYPPKTINGLYGYRTRRSMVSQDVWDFSQPFAARLMWKHGIWLTTVSFLGCFVSLGEIADVCIALGILIATCVVICVVTERELIRRFPRS